MSDPVSESGASDTANGPVSRSLRRVSNGHAVSKTDRRGTDRRDADVRRAFSPIERVRETKEWFPEKWPLMRLTVMVALIGCTLSAIAMPGIPELILLVSAVFGIFSLGKLHYRAAETARHLKFVYAACATMLPFAMLGFGVGNWSASGGLPVPIFITALCSVSLVASLYLRRNAAVMMGALSSIWIWPAIVFGTASTFLVGAFSLICGIYLAKFIVSEESAERDVRESRNRALLRTRGILADFEESGQGWFWETDRRGLITYISPPAAHVIAQRADKLIGQPLHILFDMDGTSEDDEKVLLSAIEATDAFHDVHVKASPSAPGEVWWSISGRPVMDENNRFVGYRGSGTDLTERKRSQADAARLARFDSLTGLCNRPQMSRMLEEILTAKQPSQRVCSVMLLDLDRFKQVNDTMGHPAGDELLKQVAERLQDAVGRRGQVGRLGGDEFEVLLPSVSDQKLLAHVATAIIESVSRPYSIEDQRVTIGVSIGIARAPADAEDPEDLIRNADLALYAAKDGGRGRYHFYAGELHEAAEDRVQLEKDLREAIEKGELRLVYQPIVSTASEAITGFEALLRWKHVQRGWIPPSRFIERAEDSGMIDEIGEWVLRTACRDLANWPEHIRVSVNVSPLQFVNANLPIVVAGAIRDAGIAPSRLELEITENVFLAEDRSTDATFKDLKDLGVRLALDDFGTGYSSLSYLQRAPFDKIKIDRSFLNRATKAGSNDGAMIAAVTGLAQALGMETAAEGVETVEELNLVRMHGCTHVQGYIYEHPLDVDTASERLRTGLTPVAQGDRPVRQARRTTVRRVQLQHAGQSYEGTIRNISSTGALIEGLWNVPVATEFTIILPDKRSVLGVTRWCADNRIGVEFVSESKTRSATSVTELSPERAAALELLRKAG